MMMHNYMFEGTSAGDRRSWKQWKQFCKSFNVVFPLGETFHIFVQTTPRDLWEKQKLKADSFHLIIQNILGLLGFILFWTGILLKLYLPYSSNNNNLWQYIISSSNKYLKSLESGIKGRYIYNGILQDWNKNHPNGILSFTSSFLRSSTKIKSSSISDSRFCSIVSSSPFGDTVTLLSREFPWK